MWLFSEYLTEKMARANVKDKELAAELGISRAYVTQWRTGGAIPSPKLAERVAAKFGEKTGTIAAHFLLNALEKGEIPLSSLLDPGLLRHHGIINAPDLFASLSSDEHRALDCVRRGAWAELIQWAASKLEKNSA